VAQGDGGKNGTVSKNPTNPFEQILALFNLKGGPSQPVERVINDIKVAQGVGGKEGTVSKNPMNPSEQIFALLNLAGGSPELSEASSKNSVDLDKNDIKIDDLTIEDWDQLEQILANWMMGLQQVQTNEKDIPTGNQNFNSQLDQNTPISIQNQIQQVNQEGGKNLIQWLQKISKAGNLPASKNPNVPPQQLLQQVERFLQDQLAAKGANDASVPVPSETPLNGNEKLFDIPKGIQDKLHQLMDLEVQADAMVDAKPRLILDKNLVPLIARTDVDTGDIDTKNKNAVVRPSADSLDQPKLNLLNDAGINPFQGNEGTASLPKAAPTLPAVVSVSQFAPEVSEWASHQIKISNDMQGNTEAKISLYPQHLGQVEIKITSHQGQISAEIITNTLMGKEAMEGQLNDLKHALQQQGFQVQKLDVSYQVPSTTDTSSAGFTFSDGNSHPSRDQSSSSSAREGTDHANEQNVSEVEKDERSKFTYGGRSGRLGSSQIDFSA
jgi:flagellar hook-length control protein FliK